MMLMKFESSFALCLAILFAATASRPAFSQEAANAKAPFTLTITGNLKPGDSLHFDFANASQIVRTAGAMVVIAVRKADISDHEITKITRFGNAVGCEFDVRDGSGDPVRQIQPKNEGGSFVMHVGKESMLQPGESDVSSVRLDESFDLSQPGTYTIQAWAHAWDDPKSPIVRSNTLTLIIEPADASAPQ